MQKTKRLTIHVVGVQFQSWFDTWNWAESVESLTDVWLSWWPCCYSFFSLAPSTNSSFFRVQHEKRMSEKKGFSARHSVELLPSFGLNAMRYTGHTEWWSHQNWFGLEMSFFCFGQWIPEKSLLKNKKSFFFKEQANRSDNLLSGNLLIRYGWRSTKKITK